MMIRVGDTVKGLERERQHMTVLKVSGTSITCEWYDEAGKQKHVLQLKDLEFVSEIETDELRGARERWVNGKMNFTKTNEANRKRISSIIRKEKR